MLYDCLFQTDWTFLTELSDVNLACTPRYSKLTDVFDKFIPKTIPSQPKYPPWYTNSIVTDIKKKILLGKNINKLKMIITIINLGI